ncbi:hypothetical protein Scep_023842 [Stephania cephalantha]|uniref:Protein ENHANCED DISEASE RESISTANCE 2 C-terminal domain-containing protein n=1 Tax=Stephania cephalantha TaxID=152367 RepID=A0AAP0F0W0_9MAGN
MEAMKISMSNGEGGSEDKEGVFEYFGWVYHLGVNSIGHEYCHLRFLFLRGKYVEMYKRDPHEYPGIKPIRKGVVGHTLMVEELGRRKVAHGDLYALRFYNRLDETKKGEIACATAGEVRKWMEAFDHAKQQAEYELSRGGSSRLKLTVENELNLGHQPRVKRYAHGLRKLIRIGQGPESLIRQASDLGSNIRLDGYLEVHGGDAIEAHQWKCVCAVNGIRIFEDVAHTKIGKSVLLKSVGVVEASSDTVFEVVLSLDQRRRYEWDMLTGDLELVDSLNGHYDVVYGTYDPKYLTRPPNSSEDRRVSLNFTPPGGLYDGDSSIALGLGMSSVKNPNGHDGFQALSFTPTGPRWNSKKDFVFSRQWFRDQDGAYVILQFPSIHKKRPPRSGYRRTKINRLREYFAANPAMAFDSQTTVIQSKVSSTSSSNSEFEDSEISEEFFDAIAADNSLEEEDSDDDDDLDISKDGAVRLKNIAWVARMSVMRHSAGTASNELDAHISPLKIDASLFHGSVHQGKDETDTNCWTSPSGQGFMIRGKTYLNDNSKVKGGDPLLKLLAVDWFKTDNSIDRVALHPKCVVQSKEGKALQFILVINLQVPAKPNYSLVLYYGADRPVRKGSLLSRFIDGNDMFRDSRFKLIPSIVEGYWMVKRAVGTKACLLGKAVTCRYLRQDNFLEIDVDIGSSSVARSIISLVLGYVTSIVVDLAILIESQNNVTVEQRISESTKSTTDR